MAPSCGKRSITPGISILDAQLMVYGQPILSNLPTNVRLTPDLGVGLLHGAFLGVSASEPSSRHVLTIGTLEGRRFMCCFRFKLWWMTQRMGNAGRHVPQETQFMLLESKVESSLSEDEGLGQHNHTVYTVFLPLLDGPFRASLQGTDSNELQLCLESGDPMVKTSESSHAMYIGAGADPFEVVSNAVRAVEAHSYSFVHREKKKMPGMLDCFGWCTWDAFYTDVTADAVNDGLKSLFDGGTPARFLIIDDGWQSLDSDKGGNATVSVGTQYASRLSSMKANHKFERDDKDEHKENGASLGLQHLVQASKANFQLKYIYVWHALAGYWGGVQPNAEMEQYKPVVTYPMHSPGILANQPDMAIDSLTVNGLGLVNTEKLYDFFNDLHSYLASAGIDGVKVDAQSIIETLGAGCGGRVQLVKQYIQALEASVARNFPDNGCIACMSHSSDGIYSTKQIAVVRASDDFYPRDPASHTIHIASVTYNSLFLGEFMQPDWDMFQSLHPAAAYHAAARAVGGCAIYVSDRPGQHDFELLRKLVLPDGTVLRAQLPGRPTCDSLFVDPARDGTSLLKIWNLNKFTGVLGVFNCQGAGWCKDGKINRIHDTAPSSITGSVKGLDVHLLADVAGKKWNGECVVYSHQAGEVVRLPKAEARPVTLKVLEYEVFTVTPLEEVMAGVWFAPIGLLDMLNSGAAVDELSCDVTETVALGGQEDGTSVRMKLRGCGKFGAYSSRCPKAVLPASVGAGMCYREADGLVTFTLPLPKEGQLWDVTVHL